MFCLYYKGAQNPIQIIKAPTLNPKPRQTLAGNLRFEVHGATSTRDASQHATARGSVCRLAPLLLTLGIMRLREDHYAYDYGYL